MNTKKALTMLALLPIVTMVSSCESNTPSLDNQRKFRDQPETITLSQVIRNGEKQGYAAPSTGDTRVFVVPVQFTDYPAEEVGKYYNSETKDKKAYKHTDSTATGRGAELAREDIRKVFFGEPEETMWHSLSSYYKSSSYGKLNFNGLVAPWFDVYTNAFTMKPVSAKEFAENSTAAALAQNILAYYSDDQMKKFAIFKDEDGKQMFNSGTEFLKYFDSNNDGCFDCIEMVYSAPYYATYTNDKGVDVAIDNDKFWAYCGGTTTEGDVNKPRLSKWAFQSYYTCFEGGVFDNGSWRPWTCEEISSGVAKVDGHTIIHETGHALGLADYYDYDYKRNPIASVDMMAYNVGDHDSYSKSLLGWTNPYVVTGPTTITLNSFTDTGDCIMVPYKGYFKDNEKYGNTFYTEYLAIEYYTPTGVNVLDGKQAYAGSYPVCPTQAGIKVYHVDSRLGLYDYSGSSSNGKFVGYTETILNTTSNQLLTTGNSNTGTRTVQKEDGSYNWLIEYLSKDGKSVSNVANDNMFHEGDSFGYDTYKDYTFNSGKKFGFKFTIDSMSEDSVTLTFLNA